MLDGSPEKCGVNDVHMMRNGRSQSEIRVLAALCF